MKECKIIEDLLPNYIEKLTNEETNEYIEKHLENCEDCRKKFENMKSEIKLNLNKSDDREVNYIKKVGNKLKLLRIFILIIVIILIVFIANTTRKIIILSDLSEKAEKYELSNNFKKTTSYYDSEQDVFVKSEYYVLNNDIYTNLTRVSNGDIEIIKIYYNSETETANIYTDKNGEKTVELNSDFLVTVNIQSPCKVDNFVELLIAGIFTNIESKEYGGKDYYYISNLEVGMNQFSSNLYVDKDTGLTIRDCEYENNSSGIGVMPTYSYEYEFDTVTENDFIEPDITEYQIK